jgi:hypothetical protein
MPPLWRLEELLALSDDYPSGLQYVVGRGKRKPGDQAGAFNKTTGYYLVSVEGTRYLAHRIVYVLRHKSPIEGLDIVHERTNTDKDNRLNLLAIPVKNRFS